MVVTFFCGLGRQDLPRVPDGDKQFSLEVGQRHGNIALAVRNGRRNCLRLSLLAQDLVEIGVYLHQSDRVVARDLDSWSRNLDYHVAVSEVARWQDLAPLLSRIASFISGDKISFHFYPKRSEPTWLPEIPKPEIKGSSVTLYSGGMDSSSGLSHLIRNGDKTVAVTQYSNRLSDRASLLNDLVQAGDGDVSLVAFRVVPRRTQVVSSLEPVLLPLKDIENTWRLRTFLYLALAGATAEALGVNRVFMFENGILAHNLPFDPYVIGARSTRHAHPNFLLLMEELLQRLFQREITIRNPFQFETKGCEAQSLAEFTRDDRRTPSLIARTNSCWNFPNFVARLAHQSGMQISHCGFCLPCKIRRIAILEAELGKWEPIEGQYFLDPLAQCNPGAATKQWPSLMKYAYEQHRRNLKRLMSYVERINRCEDLRQFATEWPQIFEFEGKNLSGQSVSSVIESIYKMYKRFAKHPSSQCDQGYHSAL